MAEQCNQAVQPTEVQPTEVRQLFVQLLVSTGFVEESFRTGYYILFALIPLVLGYAMRILANSTHPRIPEAQDELVIELKQELRCIEDFSTVELRSELFRRGHLHQKMTKATQSQCTYSSIRGVTNPRFEFLRRQQDGCWSD
jgi:hypothetical protein